MRRPIPPAFRRPSEAASNEAGLGTNDMALNATQPTYGTFDLHLSGGTRDEIKYNPTGFSSPFVSDENCSVREVGVRSRLACSPRSSSIQRAPSSKCGRVVSVYNSSRMQLLNIILPRSTPETTAERAQHGRSVRSGKNRSEPRLHLQRGLEPLGLRFDTLSAQGKRRR